MKITNGWLKPVTAFDPVKLSQWITNREVSKKETCLECENADNMLAADFSGTANSLVSATLNAGFTECHSWDYEPTRDDQLTGL